jgi:hypothetical protein
MLDSRAIRIVRDLTRMSTEGDRFVNTSRLPSTIVVLDERLSDDAL